MTSPVVLAGAIAGWFVAAVMLGLWLGERGRRLDAQRREGVLTVDPIEPASVRVPGQPAPDAKPGTKLSASDMAAASGAMEDRSAMKKRYVDDAVREGYDPDAAAADFDTMMTALDSGAVSPAAGGLFG